MRLLIVEDDKELCSIVAAQLAREGYEVDQCHDGEEAWYYLNGVSYDAVLLDRMLPGMDGVALLEKMRRNQINLPVILVTALGELGDRVQGLDSGADDYLVKPFAVEELSARLRALFRRPRESVEIQAFQVGDLLLYQQEARLVCHGKEKELSKKEDLLLEYLMQNCGRTLTREQILNRVWGMEAEVEDGNIDNYIYFLRRKLKLLHSGVRITTVHGIGYRLEDGSLNE